MGEGGREGKRDADHHVAVIFYHEVAHRKFLSMGNLLFFLD